MPTTIGPKFPIVITSYEIAMNDAKKFFRAYQWKYLIIDEVHILSFACITHSMLCCMCLLNISDILRVTG